MTVMFHDIHEDTLKIKKQRTVGTDADEALYADDIAGTMAAMNRLLSTIETEGEKYGLKLNGNKCVYLAFGGAGPVKFGDGKM